MRIEKTAFYYNNLKPAATINFKSASDITLEYVMKKHSKYLPQSIFSRIKDFIGSKKNTKLYELHNEVYKDLFEAKTLEEAKKLYPEFADVNDVVLLADNRSKAIKAIKKIMPLDLFTLDYLKKLYKPTSQDKLVQDYGFSNRSILFWLNERLNIKKLSGSYIQLLKMSDEKENNRIAELSRKAIYADTEAQNHRLQRAAEAHRTPEYRNKKRQEMKDFYIRKPEVAKRTGLISKITWDKCPEIKAALSEYTKKLSPYVKKVLSKKQSGAALTSEEKRIAAGYYRGFWKQHPQLRALYKTKRMEAVEEVKKQG